MERPRDRMRLSAKVLSFSQPAHVPCVPAIAKVWTDTCLTLLVGRALLFSLNNRDPLRMIQKIRGDFPVVIRFVFQAFWRRNISEIVVARKPCVSRKVRLAHPHCMIFFRKLVSPRSHFLSSCPADFSASYTPRTIEVKTALRPAQVVAAFAFRMLP